MLKTASNIDVPLNGIRKTCRIGPDDAGQRIDSFLASKLLDVSRNFAQKLIKSRQVNVNGMPCKASYELKEGDYIEAFLPSPQANKTPYLKPVAIPLNIIFEDEDIVVVNKPAGLVVHPGAGREEVSLVHALLAHCSCLSQVGAPERPGIVHRLDEDTSGAIVVAKSDKAYWNLIDQFQNRRVSKEYVAIVWGCPAEKQGRIETCINRHPKNRKKMAVSENGREAITVWNISKKWQGFSCLNVKILTGRTHQIRVHLAHIHHPVVGDEVYGKHTRRVKGIKDVKLRNYLKNVKRQMLHAFKLSFGHPTKGKTLEFRAELPDDMKNLIEVFDKFAT